MRQIKDIESLLGELAAHRSRRVLLTFHSMGDTDAIASAIALSRLMIKPTVATADTITSNAARMLRRSGHGAERIEHSFPPDVDAVVITDANDFDQCGAFKERLSSFAGPVIIVDHHAPTEISGDNVLVFDDESFNSTSSIAYEVLKLARLAINENLAELLLMGIISDSAELKNASAKTFIEMGELMGIARMDYQSVLDDMRHIAPPESRAETMQDLASASIEVKGGLLIVHGVSNGPANLVADDAIRVGADLAIFRSGGGNEASFSARLRPPLDRQYGIHLGNLMKELAPIINGTGGGHPCAAGAYGTGVANADAFLRKLLERVEETVE